MEFLPEIENFEEVSQKLEDHEKRIIKLEKLIAKGIEDKKLEKKLSIREFLLSKKLKSDVDTTLAIGYFMEKYANIIFYNVRDFEKYFNKGKVKMPKNLNLAIYSNIKKGYMSEVEEKKNSLKCWCLTQSGVKFCENNFKKE